MGRFKSRGHIGASRMPASVSATRRGYQLCPQDMDELHRVSPVPVIGGRHSSALGADQPAGRSGKASVTTDVLEGAAYPDPLRRRSRCAEASSIDRISGFRDPAALGFGQ
ncbi:hypothetical protein GCM10027259_07830 [Micromonospora palomenae]